MSLALDLPENELVDTILVVRSVVATWRMMQEPLDHADLINASAVSFSTTCLNDFPSTFSPCRRACKRVPSLHRSDQPCLVPTGSLGTSASCSFQKFPKRSPAGDVTEWCGWKGSFYFEKKKQQFSAHNPRTSLLIALRQSDGLRLLLHVIGSAVPTILDPCQ